MNFCQGLLAMAVVGTVCYLAVVGKIEATTIVAMGMYALKKFMDEKQKGDSNEKK